MKISRIRGHLAPLNVLAVALALAIVAGPPAYSAGKRLITGADVQDSSLTGADIQDGTVSGADLASGLEPKPDTTKTWTYRISFPSAFAPKDVTIGNWGLRMACNGWESNQDRLQLWRTGAESGEPWRVISSPVSAGDPELPVTASGPSAAGMIAHFDHNNGTDTQHIQVVTEETDDGISITASRSQYGIDGCRMLVTASVVSP